MSHAELPDEMIADLHQAGWISIIVHEFSIATDERAGRIVGYYEDSTYAEELWRGKGWFGSNSYGRQLEGFTKDGRHVWVRPISEWTKVTVVRNGDADIRRQALAKLTAEERAVLARDGATGPADKERSRDR